MFTILFVVCVILLFGFINLKFKVDRLEKINQYNLEIFEKKFQEIEASINFGKERADDLLERISELEFQLPKKEDIN
ncbi:hypothetical protein N3K59_18515 [Acinetobacter baumannii]|uniref:hypothetical protein n=1 Tax=Acinetobacter baumannii TaxID=470 RepID=UPI0002B954DE|nr:hypothetical protein [Acinetobacter baumannii]EKT8341497.1 hypothetical protein [Acinetobacter baumannii]EKT9569312.1 hypothetical protein [Acinetobacter baumannii]EKU0982930.1 hypothetical protein [Acinetobacter baumannii]EKV7443601.1 hypothetical protein [Acinetobacter baumannii]EKX0520498.1 hypothetical protein [Acinetobacter baumannii]